MAHVAKGTVIVSDGSKGGSIVERAHKAYQSQDEAGLRAMLADDLRWFFPGDSQISGLFTNADDLFGCFAKIGELTNGTYWAQALDYFGSDHHGVLVANVTAQRDGKADLDLKEVLLFEIEDDLIRECWHLPLDEQAWNDFFA